VIEPVVEGQTSDHAAFCINCVWRRRSICHCSVRHNGGHRLLLVVYHRQRTCQPRPCCHTCRRDRHTDVQFIFQLSQRLQVFRPLLPFNLLSPYERKQWYRPDLKLLCTSSCNYCHVRICCYRWKATGCRSWQCTLSMLRQAVSKYSLAFINTRHAIAMVIMLPLRA